MRKTPKYLAAAAALLLAASAGTGAASAREINVQVSSLGVYESKYEGCEARIVTPLVTGLAMDSIQKEVNTMLAEKALEMQERYELEVIELMDDPFAGRGAHTGWLMDYRIIDGDPRFLTLDVVEMNTVGSSSTKRTIMNFDRETGMPVTLGEFFNPRANYVKVVSDAVRGVMRRANKKQKGTYWVAPKDDGGFSSIKAGQNFYVNKDGRIVICFDKYEVAPGSSGCPEIELDMKELAPWLKAE
ncbi:RsiV family protein [Cloacibacillus sp. An23]|uniref:RsiV family protein n=1 Tax=Cloacibacillus sp. An23 TaxID=1965591 RepID=UPI000B38712F|nr:RsiV family protein [Cloacibacillus sp. An23]OUO94009.1 hypothetical protein B5F39_04915 [Cloacibacillus sp. An23]